MDGFNDIWLGKREILLTKLKYIHNNPMQLYWVLVAKLFEYLNSSVRFYSLEEQGMLKLNHYSAYFDGKLVEILVRRYVI
jgi:hypothetical protein